MQTAWLRFRGRGDKIGNEIRDCGEQVCGTGFQEGEHEGSAFGRRGVEQPLEDARLSLDELVDGESAIAVNARRVVVEAGIRARARVCKVLCDGLVTEYSERVPDGAEEVAVLTEKSHQLH